MWSEQGSYCAEYFLPRYAWAHQTHCLGPYFIQQRPELDYLGGSLAETIAASQLEPISIGAWRLDPQHERIVPLDALVGTIANGVERSRRHGHFHITATM